MKRVLLVILSIAAVLAVAAGSFAFTLLRTEIGAGWLLDRAVAAAPGFSFGSHRGDLAGGLELVEPRYRQDGLTAGAQRLEVVATPRLFPLGLDLGTVELTDVRLVLPAPSPDDPDEPLPGSLAMPIPIEIGRFVIAGLEIEDSAGDTVFRADRLEAAAQMSDRLVLRQAELFLPEGRLTVAGTLGLVQPYPARLDADGAWQGSIEGSPEPLRVEGSAGLEGAVGEYRLSIDAVAALDRFELSTRGEVDMAGRHFEGDLDWRGFRWPLSGAQAQFESRLGQARLAGWTDAWSLEGRAELAAPGLADGALLFRAEGDAAGVRIDVPEGEVLGGRLAGKGAYDWSSGGEFEASLDVEEVSTAPLYAKVPAVLSGGLSVSGRLEPLELDLGADGLTAVVEDRTVVMDGRAFHRPGEWLFEQFGLRSSGAYLVLDGSLDRAAGIAFEADVPELAALEPAASGGFSGTGRVALQDGVPALELDLSGSELAWRDYRAGRVQILVTPKTGADGLAVANVEIERLGIGGTEVDGLDLRADIGRSSQDLELEARRAGHGLVARLPGGVQNPGAEWRQWRWAGRLERLRIDSATETVVNLEQPATLEVGLDRALLRSACLLVAGRARSCLEGDWAQDTGLSANAVLDQLPLGLLGLSGEGVELTHALDGRAEFRLPPGSGPEAEAEFSLSPGLVRYVGDARPLVETNEGRIGLKMVDGAITAGTFELPFSGQGRIDLDYRVTELEQGLRAPVSGRLVADFNDLDALTVFLPIADEIRGRLDADLALSGTLERPFLAGRLELADGLIRHAASGMVLSGIEISGQIDGRGQSSLSGQFRAAEGLGHLEGTVDLGNLYAPSIQMDVTGEGLKLFDAKDLQLEVDSDIRLGWYEGALHVDGQLTVPRALVAPSVLPASPVMESPDVEVVAGEMPGDETVGTRRRAVEVFGSLDVVLGDEVDVDLSVTEADLSGQARFEWNGPVVPIADGGFNASGRVLMFGQRLDITEGRIGFPGVPADNPHLNIRAEREIFGNSEVRRAGVWITGTLRRPLVEPYTTPITTRERAQTLLVTGSDFNMERGSGAVSVGAYIAPRIFVSYGVGVFDDENVISVRYDLGRNWGVMATSGERQTGIDINYRIER